MSFRATASCVTLAGDSTSYGSGPNPDRATALAELKAKMKTAVVAAILSLTITESVDVVTTPIPTASGAFEDANIILEKALGTGNTKTAKVYINNMALSYKQAGLKNRKVDETNADIQAIATAYYDSDGTNGYSLVGDSFFEDR